ncbi:MAG: dethiobiotin synthase [Pirellulaceae bacterium]|nr:dethiobiotin synthase [Pirellulaceae bacterium]
MDNRPPGLFITGTNTEVGKTYVAALIARDLRERGVRVGVYKPAASGARRVAGRLVSDDALALWEAAGRPSTLEQVCPQVFETPLAPHLAARAEGKSLDAELLRAGIESWLAASDFVLVEGAGGLLSPMGDDLYVADLALAFGFPLVVVSPNVLGTINQTLQTLVAASHFRRPLHVAGIVLNHPMPHVEDASIATNRQQLVRHCRVPLLAELAHDATQFDAPVDWIAAATAAKSFA